MVDAVRPVLTLREAGCVNVLQTSSPAIHPVFHQKFLPFISFLIDPLPYLLFLEQGLITRYDSDNRGELVTVSPSKSFVAFDVDIYTGDIFGTPSEDPKLLLRTNQNHQKAEVLLRRSAKFAFVAYDWLGRNLYLSDIATPALIVCPLKHLKEGCLSLFHEETGSIVLHPLKGLMFWLYDDALQRSTMSGEKRGSVMDFESTMISSLSLDLFSGYIYWIDHYRGVIDSCDMNGHNRKTILKGGHLMRFLSVAVFGDHLYFTEENTHSLFKYNRLTGSRHALTSNLDFSLHLKVIHPILQNPGPRSDVCQKRSCSHLCLVTPEGAVCACPDGWDLISGKICKSPYVSTSATHINTTQSPPRASPSPGPPQKIPTPSTTTLTPLLSVINSTLGPRTETSTLPVSLCNLLCMNGGTCSYSEEKKMDYCICQAGYTGTYCNEEEPLEDLSRRSSHTHTSITVGVTLCCFLLLLLIVGVLGYMKYKRDKIVTVSEIVHFRPLLDKHNEEAEELVSDFPECISHRNRNQVYEEVSGIDSEDHGGLSWQYSTMSVDSAFISHVDENDDLTSQLISTNQKA
uniref:Low-density lipoprotein receptor-related protein 2 n=1 Tax=Magallana gigas TaxID=29159 RepID=K1QFA9_MAGGI